MPVPTGIVAIRLSRSYFGDAVVQASDLRGLVKYGASSTLSTVLDRFPESDFPTRRLLHHLDISSVNQFEYEFTEGASVPHRSLATYWRLDARGATEAERNRLVAQLQQARAAAPEVIREVYELWKGDEPNVVVSDPLSALQEYLRDPPVGVGAEWAWNQPGGEGTNVRFVDVERGWLQHQDFPALQNLLPSHSAGPAAHGTAVMGIIAATHDNGLGIKGIAKSPMLVGTASHIVNNNEGHILETVLRLIGADTTTPPVKVLEKGDVMLIEWQIDNGPPEEADVHVRDAIRLASLKGIVVIECAGNGDRTIDSEAIARDDAPPLPEIASTSLTDSGAIIVGACQADLVNNGHRRWRPVPGGGSNYGNRVDCHALGEQIVTTGPAMNSADTIGNPGASPTAVYRPDFAATSGAGAIVAGAVVVLQSMYMEKFGEPADPFLVRRALRQTGTLQDAVNGEPIGRMPDLQAAATDLDIDD